MRSCHTWPAITKSWKKTHNFNWFVQLPHIGHWESFDTWIFQRFFVFIFIAGTGNLTKWRIQKVIVVVHETCSRVHSRSAELSHFRPTWKCTKSGISSISRWVRAKCNSFPSIHSMCSWIQTIGCARFVKKDWTIQSLFLFIESPVGCESMKSLSFIACDANVFPD